MTYIPIFKPFFDRGEKQFDFHIEDSKTRRKVCTSIRNYINKNFDGEYLVDSTNKTITVKHIDLIFG